MSEPLTKEYLDQSIGALKAQHRSDRRGSFAPDRVSHADDPLARQSAVEEAAEVRLDDVRAS